jgi:hypothetical protein
MKSGFILSKRHSTLLEIIIAMALTVIVLTTLMFFYREVVVIGEEIDRVKSEDFFLRYVENRLSNILPKTVAPSASDFAFFSTTDNGLSKPGSQTLIFTYNNCVSLDKQFSGHVLGRLFLDAEGRLTLAYWPSPKRWEKSGLPPMKKEVLLENVEGLSFAFFVQPEKKESKPSQNKQAGSKANQNQEEAKGKAGGEKEPEAVPEPKGEWRYQPWLKEFKDSPAMVKVILKVAGSKEEQVFAFPLPNSKGHIIYD